MDLKEFVCEVLTQITEGVVESQKKCGNMGCRVNPEYKESGGRSPMHTQDYAPVTEVKFKVGLSSANSDGGKGGFSVSFAGLNIEASRGSNGNYSSVTSVEFSVPVALPKFK